MIIRYLALTGKSFCFRLWFVSLFMLQIPRPWHQPEGEGLYREKVIYIIPWRLLLSEIVTDCFQEAGVPGSWARVRRLPPPPVLQADHRGREGQVLWAALAGAHQVSAVTWQRPGDNPLSSVYPQDQQLPVRGRAAEPLVHRHGGPLRAPGQVEQDLGDPGRVRHQGRGEGAPRVRDVQSGEHHHTSRFQVTIGI